MINNGLIAWPSVQKPSELTHKFVVADEDHDRPVQDVFHVAAGVHHANDVLAAYFLA